MPKSYSGVINKTVFKTLFQQFIGSWEDKSKGSKKPASIQSLIKDKLNSPVFEQKVDVDYTLQPQKVKGLLLPQDITLISKNGNILAAQAIDFNNSEEVITKHTYELEVIFNSLQKLGEENIGKKHQGNFYLLFNNPVANSVQEKLLNTIKKTKSDLMNIQEVGFLDELENKLQQDNYQKFSLFEAAL